MLVVSASKAKRTDAYKVLPSWAADLYLYAGKRRGKWLQATCFDGKVARFNHRYLPDGASYHDGWNGSYHDCHYCGSFLVAWGPSPSRARKRLKRALRWIDENSERVDSCTARFEARQQVREGD